MKKILLTILLITGVSMAKDSYEEKISSYLIDENQKHLFVIGEKYHYKIDLNPQLKNILLSKNKQYLQTYFKKFEIDKNNNISGVCKIKYDEKNKTIPKSWLNDNALIYEHNDYFVSTMYVARFNITGKRYVATDIPSQHKFNKTYQITVKDEASIVDNILGPIESVGQMLIFTGGSLKMLVDEIVD
jgi:hypothetical protein